MRALEAVGREIVADYGTSLTRAGLVVQVDLLILDGAPQPFGQDVIACPASAIHTDLNLGLQQQADVRRAGERATLVSVTDERGRLPSR